MQVGEVDGNTVGVAHVGGGAVILHRPQKGLCQGLPLLGPQVAGQVHQIHLVDAAGFCKFAGAAAGAGNGLVFLILDEPGGAAGKIRQRLGEGGLDRKSVV